MKTKITITDVSGKFLKFVEEYVKDQGLIGFVFESPSKTKKGVQIRFSKSS